MTSSDADELRAAVRDHYAQAAREAGNASCCGDPGVGPDPFGRSAYPAGDQDALPELALIASLGCGNPTMLAELRPGKVVLDLGSGGGIDMLLSARRVAPNGRVYGLDMTPEMHQMAQRGPAASPVRCPRRCAGTR